jgi:hypothetical protein
MILSRMVFFIGLAAILLVLLVPLSLVNAVDPSQKAVLLSRAMSEVANCGALAVVAAIFSTVPWAVSRRKLRGPAKRGGP